MNGSDSIVIIPTYNEIENIEKIIRRVFSLEKCFHILVIDDGSPDGTAAEVRRLAGYRYYRAEAVNLGVARKLARFLWRAVRAEYARFVRHAEFIENFDRGLYLVEIRFGT